MSLKEAKNMVHSTNKSIPEKTILIIDNDEHLLLGLTPRLKSNGYAVVWACDAVAAIAVARKEVPDLIILDLLSHASREWGASRDCHGPEDRQPEPCLPVHNCSLEQNSAYLAESGIGCVPLSSPTVMKRFAGAGATIQLLDDSAGSTLLR